MVSLRSPSVLSLLLLSCCAYLATANDPRNWNYNTGLDFLSLSYATWNCDRYCRMTPEMSSFVPYAFPSNFKANTFSVVGYNPVSNQVIAAFRGSENIRNWIVNLNFGQMTPYKNYTNVMVHEGFNNAWKGLRVLEAISDLFVEHSTASIVVTGHSLGGALATLAVMDIRNLTLNAQNPPEISLWTYGSPRVGNQAFSSLFSQAITNHFRVVNNRDVVAHMPLMSMGFYHVPTEVWERGTRRSSFRVCDESGEDPSCSDSLHVTTSINDHLNYFGVFLDDC